MEQIQTTSTIFGKVCQITVFQNDKSTWQARGNYEEHFIEGSPAKTYKKAVENWKRRAEYHADFENFIDRL